MSRRFRSRLAALGTSHAARAAMPRTVLDVLRGERASLCAMLSACGEMDGAVDLVQFERFRARLVWLITVEQRWLLPALAQRLGRAPKFQKGMRRDHTDLVSLCVPLPTFEWLGNLTELLRHHLELEEQSGGLLELVERHLLGDQPLLEAIEAVPLPTLPPLGSGASVRGQLSRVLEDAGLSAPRAR